MTFVDSAGYHDSRLDPFQGSQEQDRHMIIVISSYCIDGAFTRQNEEFSAYELMKDERMRGVEQSG
jgi:hypothetical protein